MKKICIFDLDGTLLDTINTIAHYTNQALGEFGQKKVSAEKIRSFLGDGVINLFSRCLRETGGDASLTSVILERYMQLYEAEPAYMSEPFEGISILLETLKKHEVTLAVLSNKPDELTGPAVHQIFGRELFAGCSGQKGGSPIKPDPTVVLEFIKGFEKENCFFIGDSDVDMQAGKNAGIHTIGVKWGYRDVDELRAAGADYIVSHPDEIARIVVHGFLF